MNEKTHDSRRFIIPIAILVVGTTWLMNALNVIPGVDWMWAGGLAAVGVLVMLFGGINKLTVVVGPWLLAASICSVLRQTGKLSLDRQIPILTIVMGLLLLFVEVIRLPLPKILQEEKSEEQHTPASAGDDDGTA